MTEDPPRRVSGEGICWWAEEVGGGGGFAGGRRRGICWWADLPPQMASKHKLTQRLCFSNRIPDHTLSPQASGVVVEGALLGSIDDAPDDGENSPVFTATSLIMSSHTLEPYSRRMPKKCYGAPRRRVARWRRGTRW
jgi:hypothetical protein